mmetsp:Transcript_56736/g.66329  ORF Transcript_56736/g.66329 Transcript_56736/m.66329 type:complete len:800 (-) Transcript_56736:165-2564(-)
MIGAGSADQDQEQLQQHQRSNLKHPHPYQQQYPPTAYGLIPPGPPMASGMYHQHPYYAAARNHYSSPQSHGAQQQHFGQAADNVHHQATQHSSEAVPATEAQPNTPSKIASSQGGPPSAKTHSSGNSATDEQQQQHHIDPSQPQAGGSRFHHGAMMHHQPQSYGPAYGYPHPLQHHPGPYGNIPPNVGYPMPPYMPGTRQPGVHHHHPLSHYSMSQASQPSMSASSGASRGLGIDTTSDAQQSPPGGNVLLFNPPGFYHPLSIQFPENRLAVCRKCKKNYKTRDMCRVHNRHNGLPWSTAYICITLDHTCTGPDGKLVRNKLVVRDTSLWQPYSIPVGGFDNKTPICSSCKRKNYTRGFCRERHKHRHMPWSTIYVILTAVAGTAGSASAMPTPQPTVGRPLQEQPSTIVESKRRKQNNVDAGKNRVPGFSSEDEKRKHDKTLSTSKNNINQEKEGHSKKLRTETQTNGSSSGARPEHDYPGSTSSENLESFTRVKKDGEYDTTDQTNGKKVTSSEINDPLHDDIRLENADAGNDEEVGDNLVDISRHKSRTFLCIVSCYACRIKWVEWEDYGEQSPNSTSSSSVLPQNPPDFMQQQQRHYPQSPFGSPQPSSYYKAAAHHHSNGVAAINGGGYDTQAGPYSSALNQFPAGAYPSSNGNGSASASGNGLQYLPSYGGAAPHHQHPMHSGGPMERQSTRQGGGEYPTNEQAVNERESAVNAESGDNQASHDTAATASYSEHPPDLPPHYQYNEQQSQQHNSFAPTSSYRYRYDSGLHQQQAARSSVSVQQGQYDEGARAL